MTDVFISYSRRNLALIEKIDAALTARGKQVWFDKKKEPLEGIPPGSKWWDEIKHGIDSADNFLFVISPESVVSPYCNAEIAFALQQQKRIVTVFYRADRSEIATRQAIDAAIDGIDADQMLPPVVSAPVSNLRLLTRQNWLALSEVQYVSFANGDGLERSLEELVNALDLDLAWVRTLSQLRQAAQIWDANGRHDDYRWPESRLIPVRENIEERTIDLGELLESFIEPKQKRLLREVEQAATSHLRRQQIGDELALLGDPRPGVGVIDGVPDIVWLPVEVVERLRGRPIVFKDKDGNVYGDFRLQPFYIAQYLVTYPQFEAFLDANDGFRNAEWWKDFRKGFHHQKVAAQRTPAPNNPRDSISWYQSVAFSRWLNHRLYGITLGMRNGASASAAEPPVLTIGENAEVRLPTEWEWQWAAQGGIERRAYPWGTWEEGRANTTEAGLGRAIAVGMYPQGAAVGGAVDMAGNLWEWCLNDHDNPTTVGGYGNSKTKVLRGSSFNDDRADADCASRGSNISGYGNRSFGLRLVVAPLNRF